MFAHAALLKAALKAGTTCLCQLYIAGILGILKHLMFCSHLIIGPRQLFIVSMELIVVVLQDTHNSASARIRSLMVHQEPDGQASDTVITVATSSTIRNALARQCLDSAAPQPCCRVK